MKGLCNISATIRGTTALAAVLILTANVVPAGEKGNPNPGILPINSTPHGKAYGEWSGAWWQWAYSFTAANNPVMDASGQFATLGQSGSVWYLAGTFGGVADRTVTVPPGKALFIPIVNQIWVNLPDYGDNPWSAEQEAYARALLVEVLAPITGLSCQVDGREVQDITAYRCTTPAGSEYMLTLPEDNLWGIPAGTYGPCVDDGIYLMLAPLSAGQHTIHFTARYPDGSWTLEVTYHLTVNK